MTLRSFSGCFCLGQGLQGWNAEGLGFSSLKGRHGERQKVVVWAGGLIEGGLFACRMGEIFELGCPRQETLLGTQTPGLPQTMHQNLL